jgi:hypothetical protein
MNLIRNKFFALGSLILMVMIPLSGQSDYHLYFQGQLNDIEGAHISNDQFNLRVNLKNKAGQEIKSGAAFANSTDQDGWFGFVIKEISGYMLKDGNLVLPVVIVLEFSPNEHTNWIGENEDFMVSYTLSPILRDNHMELEITRLEGSSLMAQSEEQIYIFKDQLPFAYLTGGFLITTHDPVDEELIADLKTWITPTEEEPDAASRGVKGGFPTGGYHKKKK